MERIILDDVRWGMNNRQSPRTLNRFVDENSNYHGPYPIARNLNRDEGVWRARGTAEVLPMNANTDFPNTGACFGIAVYDRILNDSRYAASILNENMIMAVYDTVTPSVMAIGRIFTGSGVTSYQFDRIGTLPVAYHTTFTQVSDNHVVVSNNNVSRVLDLFNDFSGWPTTATWTVTASTITITNLGTDLLRWNHLSKAWIGKAISFYAGSQWYGGYIITAVASGQDSTTITLAVSTGLTAQAINTSKINIFGLRRFDIPKPTRAPLVEENALGNQLYGTYQYCCTYGTSDGFESNGGPWSAPLTVNGKGILVYDLPLAMVSGETWQTDTNIDRVHIYRRGGMLGSYAIKINTMFIPWRAKSGAGTGYMGQHADAPSGTFIGYHSTQSDNFPAKGVLGHLSVNWVMNELIKYTELDLTNHGFRTFTRGYDYTPEVTISDHETFYLSSYADNSADSALGNTPLPLDHGAPPLPCQSNCLTGNRFYVRGNATEGVNRVYASSTESWRYFNPISQLQINSLNNPYSGCYITVGDDQAIVKMIAFKPGIVIAFKTNDCYALTGSEMPYMQVQKLEGIPGCTSKDSVLVYRNHIYWLHSRRYYRWDGDEELVDISQTLTQLRSANFVNTTWQVAYAYDSRVFFHYSVYGDATVNSHYIEWDLRYPIPTPDGKAIVPSAIIGDNVSIWKVAVSQLRTDKDVIYAARYNPVTLKPSLCKVFGTGATFYPDEADSATLELQTPDFCIGEGKKMLRLDEFLIQVNTPAGIETSVVNISPRMDSKEINTIAYSIPFGQAETLNTLNDKVKTNESYPSRHVGLHINGGVGDWSQANDSQQIERVVLFITGGRAIERPRQSSE